MLGLQLCTTVPGLHNSGITSVHLQAYSYCAGLQMHTIKPGLTDMHHRAWSIHCRAYRYAPLCLVSTLLESQMCTILRGLHTAGITVAHHHAWSMWCWDHLCIAPCPVYTGLGLQICTTMPDLYSVRITDVYNHAGVYSADITSVHLHAWSL